MQRKNSVLRGGMAMIMAITVILILATTLALSLRLSTQTTQRTVDLYLYEQASLLSRSAAEYAMLELSKVNPCNLDGSEPELNFRYNSAFDIDIDLLYIPANGTTCNANALAKGALLGNTNTIESDGTVIMDISVTGNPGGTTEPVRYFRRSIQKL